jgi:hypothetical protein
LQKFLSSAKSSIFQILIEVKRVKAVRAFSEKIVHTVITWSILLSLKFFATQPPVIGLAVSRKATGLPDEAERGKGSQPIKPFSRSRHQAQFAVQRTDDHIRSLRAVFDQWGHTGPGA